MFALDISGRCWNSKPGVAGYPLGVILIRSGEPPTADTFEVTIDARARYNFEGSCIQCLGSDCALHGPSATQTACSFLPPLLGYSW
jgi:hypothetical protein